MFVLDIFVRLFEKKQVEGERYFHVTVKILMDSREDSRFVYTGTRSCGLNVCPSRVTRLDISNRNGHVEVWGCLSV